MNMHAGDAGGHRGRHSVDSIHANSSFEVAPIVPKTMMMHSPPPIMSRSRRIIRVYLDIGELGGLRTEFCLTAQEFKLLVALDNKLCEVCHCVEQLLVLLPELCYMHALRIPSEVSKAQDEFLHVDLSIIIKIKQLEHRLGILDLEPQPAEVGADVQVVEVLVELRERDHPRVVLISTFEDVLEFLQHLL